MWYVPEIQKLKSQQIPRHCLRRLRTDLLQRSRVVEAGGAQPSRARPWEEEASVEVEAAWEDRPCPWEAAPVWGNHFLLA